MLKAQRNIPHILRVTHRSLFEDRSFLLEYADDNGRDVLEDLPHEFQLRFPDVVDLALLRAENNTRLDWWLNLLESERLAPQLWNNRDFALRWFRLGLPFGNHGPFLQPHLKADREIFLLVAKHCDPETPEFALHSFQNASMEIRLHKKFMLQVVEIEPYLIEAAAPSLRNDFDLCLLALSDVESVAQAEIGRRRALRHGDRGDTNNEYSNLGTFRSRVAENLNAHEVFSTVVLPAMSQPTDSGCTLAGLNQGTETSRVYKKRMADYLGIPVGKKLRRHRSAMHNLNRVLPNDNNDR